MFLQKSDLKNNIYNYQVEDITEGDDAIVYKPCKRQKMNAVRIWQQIIKKNGRTDD